MRRHLPVARQALARAEAVGLRGLTVVTDAFPPRFRFGRWNDLLAVLAVRGGLPAIDPGGGLWLQAAGNWALPEPDVRCLMVAGALDSGGVEMVVAMLAQGLPAHGIAVEVVCSQDGRVARWLRNQGVPVAVVATSGLADYVRARRPDVIQLHRVERGMLDALGTYAAHTVPVFHAMETYLDKPTWAALRGFGRRSACCVAVSGAVAEFFESRLGVAPTVLLNGVPEPFGDVRARHHVERRRLAEAVGVVFGGDDIVVVALQRFSDQKNAAGLVDAFLLATETNPRLRLVIAGAPTSWLEVRRADVLRRAHPSGERVHLLGDSDPAALLLGGDLFALDSFAEGGPVAAAEAVACGLPVVLSDVGYARELVAAASVPGEVVRRANATIDHKCLARQRSKSHQDNRVELAAALLAISSSRPREVTGIPFGFSVPAMVAGHAGVLRRAAAGTGGRAPLAWRSFFRISLTPLSVVPATLRTQSPSTPASRPESAEKERCASLAGSGARDLLAQPLERVSLPDVQ